MGGSSSKSEGLQEEELIRKLRWVTIVTIVQHNRLTFAFPVVENTRTLWSCVEREYRSTREFLTFDLLRQARNQIAEKNNTRKDYKTNLVQDCTSSWGNTTYPILKLFLTGTISDRWNVSLLEIWMVLLSFQQWKLLCFESFTSQDPRPFYGLIRFYNLYSKGCLISDRLFREIFPETLSPTTTHKFFSLLHQKGFLRRIYTQNIDALEVLAGIPPEKIIGELRPTSVDSCCKCHGYLVLLDRIKCTQYKKSPLQRPMAASSLLIAPSARKLMTSGGLSFALFLKEKIIFVQPGGWSRRFLAQRQMTRFQSAKSARRLCGLMSCSLVSKHSTIPRLCFYILKTGEPLPDKFWSHQTNDFSCCDLLLVLGTSLVVSPFNTLVGKVGPFHHPSSISSVFSTQSIDWKMIIPAAKVFCEPLLHQQDEARGELLTLGLGSQHDGGLSLLFVNCQAWSLRPE